MRDTFTYNNIVSSQFDAYTTSEGVFISPTRDYDLIEVPGRSGDLILENNRYNNVNITYPMIIMENFMTNYKSMTSTLNAIKGYNELNDTFFADRFRLAVFERVESKKITQHVDAGIFNVIFNCKPQWYLNSGKTTTSVAKNKTVSMTNPTNNKSRPIIACTGTGTLTIGTQTFVLSTNTGTTIIDCELQDAYEGNINRNKNLVYTGDDEFGYLPTGTFNVKTSANLSVVITPRWFEI